MANPGVKRQIVFPEQMDERLEEVCQATGRTVSEIVREAVDRWLDDYDSRKRTRTDA